MELRARVERWRSNCGCWLDGGKSPAQQWRGPLRNALSALAERTHEVFETEGRALFVNSWWQVRDGYGAVVASDGVPLVDFVRAQLANPDDDTARHRAHELLELERATLRTVMRAH